MSRLEYQINHWRSVELTAAIAWAVTRTLLIALLALTVACLIDWRIDREQETPYELRIAFLATQMLIIVSSAIYFYWRIPYRENDEFAMRAERLNPHYGHTLVSALQLTRQNAQTTGMSQELIADIYKDAERWVAAYPVTNYVDTRNRTNTLYLLGILLIVSTGSWLMAPELVTALVSRHVLLPHEIPRSVRITNFSPPVWPIGEEVPLRFSLEGEVNATDQGIVRVYSPDSPTVEIPLVFQEDSLDGKMVFVARLPGSSNTVHYSAHVRDGRTRSDQTIRFEPRPAVEQVTAHEILPRWFDPPREAEFKRPIIKPDLQLLAASELELTIRFTKPVREASIQLRTRSQTGPDSLTATLPISLHDDGTTGSIRFRPAAQAISYQLFATDENGFELLNPLQRGLTLIPDGPPVVTLLQEVLKDPKDPGPLEDYDVSGMPIKLGGQSLIGYSARSPLGIDRAFLVYRIRSGTESSEWTALPLKTTLANPATVGRFIPELGLFEESGVFGEVEFYPIPSPDPNNEPDGLQVGGRINFQAASLTKYRRINGQLRSVPLEAGDLVDFRIAVYDRHPGEFQPPTEPPPDQTSTSETTGTKVLDSRRPAGWSSVRTKIVVSESGFEEWRFRTQAFRNRLNELQEKQRRVFRSVDQ